MMRFSSIFHAAAWLLIGASATAARADISGDFSTNPLTAPGVLIQGPDAANASSRFTYNAGDGTLTAHYDTTQPTIKLLFPLGQHVTQANSFSVTATFDILSSGFVSPSEFGGEAPSFGLVNSTTTGNLRASTGFEDSDFNFHQVTGGTSYDIVTFDYFPTQDQTFGGNSVILTSIDSAQNGVDFNDSFGGGAFTNATLPFDQFITAKFSYDAGSGNLSVSWNGGSTSGSLRGDQFDVDSFAITLWSDPNLSASAPAVPSGEPVKADVVFDSFVVAVPEPASLAFLAAVPLLLARRRRGI